MNNKICKKHNICDRYKNGKCKLCSREDSSRYHEKNKIKIRLRQYRYRKDNVEYLKTYDRQYNLNRKITIFNAYGGCKCSICNITDIDVLSVDHINGGGRKQKRELGNISSTGLYRWIINNNYPPGYRVLCMNCNFIEKERLKQSSLSDGIRAIISRKSKHKTKIDTLNVYGNCKCAICNIENLDVLSIDHINGGGNQHRKEIGRIGGVDFYCWLKNNNYPKGYRVLCMNCQFRERERLKTMFSALDLLDSRIETLEDALEQVLIDVANMDGPQNAIDATISFIESIIGKDCKICNGVGMMRNADGKYFDDKNNQWGETCLNCHGKGRIL